MIMAIARVLYVENTYGVGGSTTSLYRLVQQLDRRRFEPVILFHRPNGFMDRFRALGLEVIVLSGAEPASEPVARPRPSPKRDVAASLGRLSPAWAAAYRTLKSIYLFGRVALPTAWQIRRVIRQRDIDLVHLNNRLKDNRSGALAAWLTGTPCMCHVRDFGHVMPIDRWLAPRVGYFVFVSRALERQMRETLPDVRGEVIYDGLPLGDVPGQAARTRLRAAWGLADQDFVVGNIGRLVAWKGQDVFLRALARVAPRVPRLRALVVGNPDPPSETAYLRHLQMLVQQLGLAEVVRFTGFLADVPAVLSAVDVLVHSSVMPEPFGLVVVEGMAAGCPVIATNAGGVPDMIETGCSGLLVPPGDEAALAEALISLADDPDRAAQLGAAARQRALTHFTLAQFASGVEQVYGRLLGCARSSGSPELREAL
jgi:glycosyltransferase involved in cell wall biosynthesis